MGRPKAPRDHRNGCVAANGSLQPWQRHQSAKVQWPGAVIADFGQFLRQVFKRRSLSKSRRSTAFGRFPLQEEAFKSLVQLLTGVILPGHAQIDVAYWHLTPRVGAAIRALLAHRPKSVREHGETAWTSDLDSAQWILCIWALMDLHIIDLEYSKGSKRHLGFYVCVLDCVRHLRGSN